MKLIKLVDFVDKSVKAEIGDYYIISKDRLENLTACFESAARFSKEQANRIAEQQAEIEKLSKLLMNTDIEQDCVFEE